MPRPGPRPYECVRRAWHSDRHQPIRGSIIQEIFRLVNEIHSPSTRKNKEWQEKLPVVVLKAEEIIYSKANSEEEYKDLKTLWERTNDAINTIIRRDESSETGDFLQPCIEAALNLGCTPRRASRSQRHNPRFYLSSTRQGSSAASIAHSVPNNTIYQAPSNVLSSPFGNPVQSSSPQLASSYSISVTPTSRTPCFGSDHTSTPVFHGKPLRHEQLHPPPTCLEYPPYFEKFGISCYENESLQINAHPSGSVGRMYPLYYGSNHHVAEPNYPLQPHQGSNSNRFTITPPISPIMETRTGFLPNSLSCKNAVDASSQTVQCPSNFVGASDTVANTGCDLSLRIGPNPIPSSSRDNSSTLDDVVSTSSREGPRLCDLSSRRVMGSHLNCSSSSLPNDREFCFFPDHNFDNIPEFHLSNWNSAGEIPSRKRKAPVSTCLEDEQNLWWPRTSKDQFFDRMAGQIRRHP